VTDAFRPNFELLPGGTEDNIVSVYFNRNIARDQELKGKVVLQAQQGERKKIPHKLASTLPDE